MSEKPQVSVIIVSWNVREHLRANLARLFSLPAAVSFEVLVADNGSVDGTTRMVRTEFPQVKLIANDYNAGFAAANNRALRLAQGEVCLLLNPDMALEPGALEVAHRTLSGDQAIGVLGVRLVGAFGRPVPSVRRFPDFASQLAILLKVGYLFPAALERYLAAGFDYSRSQDVDQVRGSFFAFRRELLATVGYLDEDYFIWFEEADWCRRVRQFGYRVRYCAEATAVDLAGRSFVQVPHGRKQAIFTRSMATYFLKHGELWQYGLLMLLRPFAIAAASVVDLMRWCKKINFDILINLDPRLRGDSGARAEAD